MSTGIKILVWSYNDPRDNNGIHNRADNIHSNNEEEMIYIIIYFAIFALYITILLMVAKPGYQDKTGFHYGKPKGGK